MLVSEFITILRRAVKDLPVLTQDLFDGDGNTKFFRTREAPILESSFTVTVDSITKTETTDYTFDRDTGVITFVSAPASGSDNIAISYKYINTSDTEWLEIINDIVLELRDKIWTDNVDESTLTTVKDQIDYDLSDLSDNDIIDVLEFRIRKNTDQDWHDFSSDNKWKYQREQKTVILRPGFGIADYLIRIRYLLTFAVFSAVTDTFDIPLRYQEIFKNFARASHIDLIIMKMINNTGSMTKADSFESLQSLENLAVKYKNRGEKILEKVRPIMPAKTIRSTSLKQTG